MNATVEQLPEIPASDGDMPAYIERDTYEGKWSVSRRSPKTGAFLASEIAAMMPEGGVIFESMGLVNGVELFARSRFLVAPSGALYVYRQDGSKLITHPAGRKLRLLTR